MLELPNFDDFSKWNKLQNLEKGVKFRPKIPNFLYPDSSLKMTLKTAKFPPINTIELVLYTYISIIGNKLLVAVATTEKKIQFPIMGLKSVDSQFWLKERWTCFLKNCFAERGMGKANIHYIDQVFLKTNFSISQKAEIFKCSAYYL